MGASERKWDAGSDGDMVDVVVVVVSSVVSDVDVSMIDRNTRCHFDCL